MYRAASGRKCIMTEKEQKLHRELLDAAQEAAFAAAEAMGRRDAKEWSRLQDKAADLRNQAENLASDLSKQEVGQEKKTGDD
jgi:hypothetical protein